jgi:2-polyprenyl-3-methyl-5-hydroxy-6-metoxy-1,4-benzoquinol methylase
LRDFSRLCEGFQETWVFSGSAGPDTVPWDCIILDRFRTPEAEFRYWAALAPLIGIDEGGPCRRRFDFLIDLLPGLYRGWGPNIRDPSLIPLPKNRRPLRGFGGAGDRGRPLRTLVSFGAEDPAGLGPLVCRALAEKNSAGELDIDYLPGGLQRPGYGPGAVRVLPPRPGLAEALAAYDLLITHFGLTAFEALSAGAPVLLVSPGPVHEKLARRAGFFSAGIRGRGARRAAALLFRPKDGRKTLNRAFLAKLSPEKIAARHGLDRPQEQNLADLLETLSPLTSPVCPACGRPNRPFAGKGAGPLPALARFPRRTYRRCPDCGVVFMERLDPPPIEYSRDYFFDFYKKQYGKTYIEDFPGLIAAGRERLKRIRALLPGTSGGGRLLDIGCAYGPFLAAAKEAGFSSLGIDPAEDAVRYVRETLKLEACRGFFPETAIPALRADHGFDAVCLWYVIEHFREPRQALAEARRLLRPGGVLAVSTPSLSGVSGRKNRRAFLEKSPADHWTLWSPRSCGRILKKAGFRLRRVHSTGHHPERFPLPGFLTRRGGILSGPLLLLSRIFRLGDTFEAYAIALPEKRLQE